jgi:hypothetical protein
VKVFIYKVLCFMTPDGVRVRKMDNEKESLIPQLGATEALGAGASAGSQPQSLIEYLASSEVVVNTWKTKNVGWILKSGNFQDRNFVKEFIESLREKVLSLPVRVSLPRHCSLLSFPRYYMIFCELDHFAVKSIIEIVGIRADNSPTKWSYRFGYWHPECQWRIIDALQELLSSY